MTYGFKCPQCGGFKWGTLDCGKPKQEWIGTCNGDRDYPGCGFRWHRSTEDEKIIGIPFGDHDKAPNAEFSGGAPLHGAASAGTKGYTSGEDNGD